jgi:Flp pilus assembly protein TadG
VKIVRWPSRAQKKTERGQSVVEIAVGLPFLLIIVLAVLEFGIVFATYLAVVNAAHEGAVFASMYPQLADSGCGKTAQPGCTGAYDNQLLDGSSQTLWTEYLSRVANETYIQPGQVLRSEGLITSGDFYLERPYSPVPTTGNPISVTVHYTVSTLTSGMSLPLFGRLGLPNSYHIRYEYALPVRGN